MYLYLRDKCGISILELYKSVRLVVNTPAVLLLLSQCQFSPKTMKPNTLVLIL